MPEIPPTLIEHVRSGRCILFLGAGVHAAPPAGSGWVSPEAERPPMARELARRLAEESHFADYFPADRFPDDYPPQLHRVSLFADTPRGGGRRMLVQRLQHHLDDGKAPSPALRALSELPFPIVVTTNYDRLFEAALRDAGKEPVVRIYNPDPNQPTDDYRDDLSAAQPLLFKIHGDFSRSESIVITDEDYIAFVQRMGDKDRFHPVPGIIRFHLQRWPTLFLGYSLRDFNLRLLFRTLRWGVDESNIPLSFSVDQGPDPLVQQFWENERNLVLFVVQDLWTFVPQLYESVLGRPLKPDGRP